ncbi:ATP-binding cassette domain-containing protein [Chromobacterium paludis]|uniref:ATP-binding cassette domain-containing protein n=1 Tax=Chromobacterium paludis TaxID=2605945 RepID=A0A5C1DGX3_9NEIS|nr:ATP-binding cassette domain-containing protein [Chromobacterium paludis]QEL54818.1 ATP-binding cassette domain-containing protein [Chromobacterium paludis]
MLEIRQASLSRQASRILDNISLTVHTGELLVVLGPNGAGKSSLLKLLSGLWRPDQGEVLLDGQALSTLNSRQLAARRAVMEQHPCAPADWTGEQLVAAGAYLHAATPPDRTRAAIDQALELADAHDLRGRRLAELSGGERQRLHLARALSQLLLSEQAERYLLLDEPTAALDFALADALMAQTRALCRQPGIGALAVVHDLNLALRHADKVLLLNDGQAAGYGDAEQIMQRERLERVYGVRLAELTHPEQPWRAFIPLPDA